MLRRTPRRRTAQTPLFARVRQYCTVVDDFEDTVTRLTEDLGIGPFRCWHFRPPVLYDTTFRGAPAPWTMKLGITWLGDVQWEVIEPTTGASVYREHLERHGRGVHHLLMDTGAIAFERAAATLARRGHPFAQTARLNPPLRAGRLRIPAPPRRLGRPLNLHFGYIDADATLRTSIELTRYPLGVGERLALRMGAAESCIPAGRANFERSLPNRRLRRAVKTTIVTADLEDTVRAWMELAGVRPWHIVPHPAGRAACALVDDSLVELLEPTEASPYRAVLEARGEGVATIGVEPTEGLDALCTHLATRGYRVDRSSSNGTAFVHARDGLGTDLELLEGEIDAATRFAALPSERILDCGRRP